ncbi:Spo11 [Trypoxylus dichotomus]
MSQRSQELLRDFLGIPIQDRLGTCRRSDIEYISKIKNLSFLGNNYSDREEICDHSELNNKKSHGIVNKTQSSSCSYLDRNVAGSNRFNNSTLDQHFRCKKTYFNNSEKNDKQKVAFVNNICRHDKDAECSFTNRATELSSIGNTVRNFNFPCSSESLVKNKPNIDNSSSTRLNFKGNSSNQRHEADISESRERTSFNRDKQVINYQELLEDDLDLFEQLNTCSNDEFINLLCSISTANETAQSTKRNNKEKNLLQLKYVREVDRSQPKSGVSSHDFNSTQQNGSRTLCERCSSEILLNSQNNSQNEYQFKYVRERKRYTQENCGNNGMQSKYQRLSRNSTLSGNKPSQQSQVSDLSGANLDLPHSTYTFTANETDFVSLHTLSTVEGKIRFPFSACTSFSTSQTELHGVRQELKPYPNTHPCKILSENMDNTRSPLFGKKITFQNTQQSFNSSWGASQIPNTLTSNLGSSNIRVGIQDIENLTSIHSQEYNLFAVASKHSLSQASNSQFLESKHENESTPLPSQNLTKINDLSHSNSVSQSTQTGDYSNTKRIQILENILLDNKVDVLNTSSSGKVPGVTQNNRMEHHESNTSMLETKAVVDMKVIPATKITKAHILKKSFTQNLLYDEKENLGSKVDVYETDLIYLKEFLEEKLQDIGEYLHKCENGDNNASYINSIILNNLDDTNDETFLRTLDSQDIFSQPLSYTPTLINRATLKCSQALDINDTKTPSHFDEKLINVIDNFVNDKTLISQGIYDIRIPEIIKKKFILRKISDIFIKLLNDIKNDDVPILRARNTRGWENCDFDTFKSILIPSLDSKNVIISLQNRHHRAKFNLTVFVMGKIVDLLLKDSFCTKRELYYQMKNFVKHQIQINAVVDLISSVIEEPPWEFGVLATQKGLVYGDLTITLSESEVINCNTPGGTLVPQNLNRITKLESNASFILIVEKDSIFQKLLDEDLPNQLPRSFIMITGKGFSDVSTRLFVKKLWQILYIPVFALVDADPSGIEIMLTYRFGSLALAHLSDQLALPSLRWIGIHPKEIISLNITRQSLTQPDKRKIRSLLMRPYMDSVPKIREELEVMLQRDFKAEIEGVMKGNNYLRNFYIPGKLCAQDFI